MSNLRMKINKKNKKPLPKTKRQQKRSYKKAMLLVKTSKYGRYPGSFYLKKLDYTNTNELEIYDILLHILTENQRLGKFKRRVSWLRHPRTGVITRFNSDCGNLQGNDIHSFGQIRYGSSSGPGSLTDEQALEYF